MYIVRVSSHLLIPLQAAFWKKVFWELYYNVLVVFRSAVWGGGTPPVPPLSSLSSPVLALHLFFHLSAVSVTADPCSCFCGASIVSNELRRNTPQEEWQPMVMFPPFLLLCSNHTHTTFVKPQKRASTLWIVWIYAICVNGIIVWKIEGLRVFSGKWGVYGKNSSCLQIPTAKSISFGVGRFFLSVNKERILVKIKKNCVYD